MEALKKMSEAFGMARDDEEEVFQLFFSFFFFSFSLKDDLLFQLDEEMVMAMVEGGSEQREKALVEADYFKVRKGKGFACRLI